MLKVVVFSGGRGSNSLVKELIKDETIKLSLIVNAYDDGKSTGQVRSFFNMLGPSDIRKNQENLMTDNFADYSIWSRVFKFRFPKTVNHEQCITILNDFIIGKSSRIGDVEISNTVLAELIKKLLKQFLVSLSVYEKILGKEFDFTDCSLSNCLYAGAYELLDKSFTKTIDLFNILLHVHGEVIPTNLENKKLMGIRENGEICYNEAEIVELRSSVRIKDIYLVDEYLDKNIVESNFKTMAEKNDYLERVQSYVHGTNAALTAIKDADIIIYAPGTQHSSLFPSYMTLGIPEAIFSNVKALKVFICNIGEDYETPGYTASEFLTSAYRYMTRNTKMKMPISELIDVALVNTSRSKKKEDIRYVENDFHVLEKLPVNVIYDNFESDDLGKHNAVKVVETVNNIYYEKFLRSLSNDFKVG